MMILSFIIIQLLFSNIIKCDSLWDSMLNVTDWNFQHSFLPNYVNVTEEIIHNGNISNDCRHSFEYSMKQLQQRQNWSVMMFNSWAKFPPSGTMRGTLTDFGDYDQCLSIDQYVNSIETKYCLIDIGISMPQPIPRHHNYFHQAKVLPNQIEDERKSIFLSNGSMYLHLANISSIFYYANIQIGICIPEQCSSFDVKQFLSNGLICTLKSRFIIIYFLFLFIE